MAFYSMAFLCFIVLFVFLHEFASVFILLMLVFDAAFELDEGTTESMLTKYSGLSDIDTVFVGNSAGEMLDSQLYSEITGDNGFNMCTPPHRDSQCL